MVATTFDLGALLGPIGSAAFFRDHWEREPLHVARGAPGFYRGLLSTADVEQVITFTRPKFVDPGAFSETTPRARTYVQGWLADRQLQEGAKYASLDEVHHVYARGLTVILMTMQQRWGPVAVLCRALEAEFRCPVHANLYLTPPGAQGFDAHFDTHEVFVLQLEGSKQWRLYDAPRPLPLVDERSEVPKDRLGPPREVSLEAGDLLYVPRGVVHEAFTSELASMHLTVGVNVYRWADLLDEALTAVTREDRRFREAMPREILGPSGVTGAVRERFAELLEVLKDRAEVEGAVGALGDQFFGQLLPLPGDRFAPPVGADEIGLDTILEREPGRICRVVERGGWVTIEYPGGQVGGPLKIATALRFVAQHDRFPVVALPDDLGGDAKLVLARRLVRERLLRVAGPASK
ncbi:MAG TPA: cupin domain-containing protein [Isosphaeraceae bacterium]|jgi:ribosomal protein L16 Arg81 hydroxylase|nr:cupin domain-containing protein [Isosphaeraceae bacterium]